MTFTPIQAALGGLTLGLSTFWHARLYGKVTGISGLVRAALRLETDPLLFVLGLAASSRLRLNPRQPDLLAKLPAYDPFIAGVLVGLGSTLCNGCTSGHSVCGLARLSTRSIVATVIFMAAGMAVATLRHAATRYFVNRSPLKLNAPSGTVLRRYAAALLAALVLPPLLASLATIEPLAHVARKGLAFTHGLTFGLGLAIAGMTSPAKIIAFLDLSETWDPSLPFVFVGALPIAYLGFAPLRKGAIPLLERAACLPTNTLVDLKLVLGAGIFGAGWGWVGLCPGPAVTYLAGVGGMSVMKFLGGFAGGGALGEWIGKQL